jgi:hypothetical protein
MDESTDATVGAVGNETSPVDNSSPVGNGHPAWDEVLSILPEGFHDPIKERLNKWDQGVQERFQTVHSEYEPYKPFKEAGVSGEQLEAAWQLFALANSDPQGLYKQLGEFFGFAEQGQQAQEGQQELDLGETEGEQPQTDPMLEQLRVQQEQMQNFLVTQYEQQQQQEADAWLDQRINALPETIRNDSSAMNYILNVTQVEAQKGGDFDKAFEAGVAAFNALVNNVRSAPRAGDSAPFVMPTSGGVPVSKSPVDLTDKERRATMAQMLQSANNT